MLSDHVVSLAWSPDGQVIAAASIAGSITVLAAGTGQPEREFAGHAGGTVAIAMHPARPWLASAGQDGHVRIWDLASGTERFALEGGATWVERLAWSAQGRWLASAAGRKVRLWEAESGRMQREYAGHPATIADLAWQPNSETLAVAAYGGVWQYQPDRSEAICTFHWKGSPLKLAWSPNGKMLAHGNQDATVHFWYTDTGEDLHMSGYPTKIRELSWEFTSRMLATGGGEVVCLWDCSGRGPEGTRPKMLEGHAERITTVAYQHRGFLLASGGADGRLLVWQPANRTPLLGGATFEGTEVSEIAWSPDDQLLAGGSGLGAIALFRML